MKSFETWEKRYTQNDLLDFSNTEEGRLWLKFRSIHRKDLFSAFCTKLGIKLEKGSDELIWAKMNSDNAVKRILYDFMKECQKKENERIDLSFESIRSNLYKMNHFHWGGGFRNSLDKAIVTRYIKTDDIIPYDDLDKICQGELLEMSRGYLLNSWYNYWSSVLIENLFRRNPDVMPAYGKIKNVDFFVKDFPFDLKVTYIPKEYSKLVRKELGIEEPLKILKRYAKQSGILYDDTGYEDHIQYELTERLLDSGTSQSRMVVEAIKADLAKTVEYIMNHKRELIKWLYENQGDMRFGSENRVFLVLVDKENPDEAWKLKRNIDLIKPAIQNWIQGFDPTLAASLLVTFDYQKKRYQSYSDIIFVCK